MPLSWVNRLFVYPYKNTAYPLIIVMSIVAILSLLPQDKLPKVKFESTDLVVHFAMYSSIAFVIVNFLYDKLKTYSTAQVHLIFFSISLYGFVLEILQKILPINRYFSWTDVIANCLGAAVFYIFVIGIRAAQR